MEQLKGTGVALVTPFTDQGQVDVPALGRIVEHCIDGGVDYLVALGTTAESVTLTKAEKMIVMDTIAHVNADRLPLVIGIGGNNTMAVVQELQILDLSRFSAILSVSPYYNRPTQEGIYQHFKAIAHASPLPIVLYNVPGRTGSNMLPETTVRLARDFPNIVGIKEACGQVSQIMQLIAQRPSGFLVLSGDDLTALPAILAGGEGVISVLAQGYPRAFSEMVQLGRLGDAPSAYRLHYTLQEAMELIFEEGNPAGIKAIFEILGLSGAAVRLPLMEASTGLKGKLARFHKSLSGMPV
jgi:4-hydroxy-tetrahydrodipicolinate synthase